MTKRSGDVRTKEEAASVNRREQILEAAVVVFAEHGYFKATTAQVAEKVGISQPYIFKLFKNKEELFVAALDRAFERTIRTFSAVEASGDTLLEESIRVYEQMMETHPSEIILQVQALGIRDEAIRRSMQTGMNKVTQLMESKFTAAGIAHPEVEVSTFMANGMLCHIAMALEMPELKPKHLK
ncbi:TetR/AcrR family transcriptional regulator [Paenibacillus sonchi]|uniref:TetR/AcrR family transcriptional regulator n=1 Tax=Paenibacillus sonchi TaxID=373687 RepID=A0A974PEN5_9BACL|nr:TetR/AcrR family transcriptional regulator [Paenibacillus sonchi]MCE3203937.1 TetR/AcrR family transcriptional regulator [Paenibacillus sonchi]QQZ62430.1 TetR/AcrR family transcriptional regulator [Paenibacillus sonchi]